MKINAGNYRHTFLYNLAKYHISAVAVTVQENAYSKYSEVIVPKNANTV